MATTTTSPSPAGLARRVARTLLPGNVREFIKRAIDRDYREAKARERFKRLAAIAWDATGGRVAAGPFKGMRYERSLATQIYAGPKLLGCYEREVAEAIEEAIARGYDTVYQLGAGEGYYAVGMALRMPSARMVCYEADDRTRGMLEAMADHNGVRDRLEIHGICTADVLRASLDARGVSPDGGERSRRTLILIDIEGAEWDVLDPRAIGHLRHLDVLVELHDVFRPGVMAEIRRRCEPTHEIQHFRTQRRRPCDFPDGVAIDPALRLECMDEDRGHTMHFFWMKAKRSL